MRRSFRRVPVSAPTQAIARNKSFPAPIRGWIDNENLAASKPQGCRVLENWFPTTNGLRLRKGHTLFATIGTAPVESMFTYVSGLVMEFFAADGDGVYNISSVADAEVAPTAEFTGQTSGYYSTAQFAVAGGDYLYAVNGTDPARLYDGTDWFQINGLVTKALPYDAETGTFTAGLTVTGGTSAATATILEVIDNGTDGTLLVQDISGTFQDNETITDSSTGSADANIPSGVTDHNNIAITGVDTSDLSHVWVYRNRLYFVEKNTRDLWYLPVDSVGGAATKFTLNGIVAHGGSAYTGGTWSLDAGDGIDDKLVVITDQGEVVVFDGSYPGGSDWSLVGRYDASPPLGIKALMRAGGDLLIATRDGVVPLTVVIRKDRAALALGSVSRPIEQQWKKATAERGSPWELLKVPDLSMMIVASPSLASTQPTESFVVNLETGAWAKYTGWDTQCLALHNNEPYFGTSDGTIMLAEDGGSDNGATYVSTAVFAFDHLGTPGVNKMVPMVRSTFLAGDVFIPKISVSFDYTVSLPAAPSSVPDTPDTNAWDVGLWDVALWDSGDTQQVSTKWSSVGRTGFAIAPQVQVTSGTSAALDVELVAIDLQYITGAVVV